MKVEPPDVVVKLGPWKESQGWEPQFVHDALEGEQTLTTIPCPTRLWSATVGFSSLKARTHSIWVEEATLSRQSMLATVTSTSSTSWPVACIVNCRFFKGQLIAAELVLTHSSPETSVMSILVPRPPKTASKWPRRNEYLHQQKLTWKETQQEEHQLDHIFFCFIDLFSGRPFHFSVVLVVRFSPKTTTSPDLISVPYICEGHFLLR